MYKPVLPPNHAPPLPPPPPPYPAQSAPCLCVKSTEYITSPCPCPPHLLADREHVDELLLAALEEEAVHGCTLTQALPVWLAATAHQVHQCIVLGGHVLRGTGGGGGQGGGQKVSYECVHTRVVIRGLQKRGQADARVQVASSVREVQWGGGGRKGCSRVCVRVLGVG